MWPVMMRSWPGTFGSERYPPPRLDRGDIVLAKPYRNFDGDGDRIVRQHEALKRLVAELVIADCRDDECGGVGGRVVPDVDDRVRGVGEGRCSLRGAGFRVPFPAEKVVRAIRRDVFEKIGERREARVAFALVVEGSGPQEFELRAMVGVAVDLAVIELDGADGLSWRESVRGLARGDGDSCNDACTAPAMTRSSTARRCGGFSS